VQDKLITIHQGIKVTITSISSTAAVKKGALQEAGSSCRRRPDPENDIILGGAVVASPGIDEEEMGERIHRKSATARRHFFF